MLFHQDILNGFQVIERAQLLTNMLKYNTEAKSVTLVMNFETFNHSIQCVILSMKDSYVQKIIVKGISWNAK